MKSINWNSVKKAVIDNEENFYEHGAVYNINGFEDRTRALIDEPLEVKYAGTGMILIHRVVFEKINHLVSSYCADTINGHEIPRGEIIKEYWKTDIDEDENRLLSEDFNFCKMFRSVGGKIYVDLQAKVGHLGSYLFSGQIYR